MRLLLHVLGWPLLLVLLLALLSEVALLAVLFGEHDYQGRIYPNVTVRGVDVSNQNSAAAHTTLHQHYADFLESPVVLRYGDQTWHPRADQLGLSLDIDSAVRSALQVGRTETRVENARTVTAVWEQGLELPLHVQVDQQQMQRYLLGIASEIESPPHNADVALDTQRAQTVITPERPGLQVLVDEMIGDITAAVQHLEPQQLPLRTRQLNPVVRDADIVPVVASIRTLLDEPVRLINAEEDCLDSCRWEWSPQQIAHWIHLVRGMTPDGIPTIAVELDQTAIRNALIPVAAATRKEGTLPRLEWRQGQLHILQPGQPGRGLDVTRAQAFINEALSGGPRNQEMPFVELPPPVNALNLASLDIGHPVATGVSSFRRSQQYRITNIQAGARRLHGILIPDGAEFSFNEALGTVDASGGFVQGSAIVQNRTQQEWGGGLCQVSTTMYRAAFWSGLPITERHEHDFRIGWYEELGEPPGMDAAIYTGALDLRFINDTGSFLLIQTGVDLSKQKLYITLYGSPSNRTVKMSHNILKHIPRPNKSVTVEDPNLPRGTFKQTDWAQPGLEVEVYRDVWQGNTLLRRDTFHTLFEAWPNVYVRGTGSR
jgi:vancomycin resistance protein YoaR